MKRTMNKWKVVAVSICLLLAGICIAQPFEPYSMPQGRMAAPINWVLFPEAVQAAKKEYDEGVAKAKAEYEKAVAEVSKPLVNALTVAQKEATQEGNLELAIALRDAKNAVEVGDSTPDRSAVRKLMIGRWKVAEAVLNRNHFFVFKEDGSVKLLTVGGVEHNTGRWRVNDKGVEIKWPNDITEHARGAKFWHFLPYPIKARLTVGDSWLGLGSVRAQKVK